MPANSAGICACTAWSTVSFNTTKPAKHRAFHSTALRGKSETIHNACGDFRNPVFGQALIAQDCAARAVRKIGTALAELPLPSEMTFKTD
jgi:hypothetical protein